MVKKMDLIVLNSVPRREMSNISKIKLTVTKLRVSNNITTISGFHSSSCSKVCSSYFPTPSGDTWREAKCPPYRLRSQLQTSKIVSAQLRAKFNGTSYRKTESERLNVVQNVCQYINNVAKVSGHKKYAYSFIFYLSLNVLNVIFNIYLLDIFIDGEFKDLGSRFVFY